MLNKKIIDGDYFLKLSQDSSVINKPIDLIAVFGASSFPNIVSFNNKSKICVYRSSDNLIQKKYKYHFNPQNNKIQFIDEDGNKDIGIVLFLNESDIMISFESELEEKESFLLTKKP